jgi:hypothetical protein
MKKSASAVGRRVASFGTALSLLALASSVTRCGSSSSDRGGAVMGSSSSSGSSTADSGHHIKTIFLIVMENNDWSSITPALAPYIHSLLPMASYCTSYYDNPSAQHPSEPNYVWLEAGNNLGITSDADPSATHLVTGPHLASLMNTAGVTWREYAEGITTGTCPVTSSGFYAAKHVPFVFFSDIVGTTPSTTAANCVGHMKNYADLHADLTNNAVAQYNFITPDLCNDMHGAPGCPGTNEVTQGDTWLSTEIPLIMASQAYKDDGAIFITWDESELGEFPIGMIVLSPLAKGGGYTSSTKYYHSSMVRTVQEVFGLVPLLNDAANQPDLSDLFTTFP